MPDPDRLLRTLQQAVQAFIATPGRSGRLVRLDDAEEVLASGDLHGNVENFRLLMRRADLGKYPRRHLILQELIHGSSHYPEGGDKSHQLVDLLAALKCQYPRQVHMLLGNHELAQRAGRWIGKAARADLDLGASFRQGVETAYGSRATEIYAAYLQLFDVIPLAVRTPNRVFLSHSFPGGAFLNTFEPAVLEQDTPDAKEMAFKGSVHSLVWGRNTHPDNVAVFLRKVDADLLITGCPQRPADHS
jgi:hypothetical protein